MDIVTIVYAAELNLLRLQARSFARFLAPDPALRLRILVNDPPRAAACAAFIAARVLPEYGPLAPQVRVLDGREVAPGIAAIPGYVAQQVLKLRYAARVGAADYVTLDAKNLLAAPFDIAAGLWDEAGRPRASFEAFAGDQAAARDACFAFWGVPSGSARPAALPAMMTPYVLRAPLVRRMIGEAEARAGGPDLEEWLARQHYPSEYLLYATWLVARGIDPAALFAPGPPLNLTLWRGYAAGAAALRQALEGAGTPARPFLGLHRLRIAEMTAEERAAVQEVLAARGLAGAGEAPFWAETDPDRILA